MRRVMVVLLCLGFGVLLWRLPLPVSEEGPETAPTTDTPTATAEATPRPVRAVLTPTGVPVVVQSPTEAGWIVTTPCEQTATVTGTPIDPVPVVLDPGHGGPVDTGAQGQNGLVEADINLRLAGATATLLRERGIGVLLTRGADHAITLPARVALAEAVAAEVLVSIHHNAPTTNASPVPGTEVFVQTGSAASSRLGGLLHEEVTTALSPFDVDWDAAPDAGVLRVLNPEGLDAYGMVRRPPMTAVLLEMGYLANPPEAELFATPAYLDVASVALADAIEAFLTTERPGTGFGNPPRIRDPGASAATIDCEDPALQ